VNHEHAFGVNLLWDSLLPSPTYVSIAKEISKRRTFAIISHPDAGKTTLTEKLLLYGGAGQVAGSVTRCILAEATGCARRGGGASQRRLRIAQPVSTAIKNFSRIILSMIGLPGVNRAGEGLPPREVLAALTG
jgi:hypothetical protein